MNCFIQHLAACFQNNGMLHYLYFHLKKKEQNLMYYKNQFWLLSDKIYKKLPP